MRSVLLLLGATAFAACAPTIPDSAEGVGFQDYSEYERNREAQLRGQGAAGIVPPPQVNSVAQAAPEGQVSGQPLSAIRGLGEAQPETERDDSSEDLAREAVAALGPRAASEAAEADATGGVSDQGFAPSAASDTPETEAERQARMAAQYEQIAPSALPERPEDATNIVEYALSTTHRVGQSRYRRSAIQFRSHEGACAQFANQDLAQEEFLRRGGPERDPLNLDPDGDGFACWWDPEPYRAAARAAREE